MAHSLLYLGSYSRVFSYLAVFTLPVVALAHSGGHDSLSCYNNKKRLLLLQIAAFWQDFFHLRMRRSKSFWAMIRHPPHLSTALPVWLIA